MLTPIQINNALKSNFKEIDRAYLNTLGDADARLLASYKTAFEDVKKQLADVYANYGANPSITQLNKGKRLLRIETQLSNRIKELNQQVTNIISGKKLQTIKTTFTNTVNGVNQAFGVNFTDAILNEKGMKNFLEDTLWSDAMKDSSAQLWSSTKRELETVLRANAREEIISGVAQGKSYASISKSIEDRFDVARNRAKTIAFTETHKAHNYAREEALTRTQDIADKYGIEAGKVWRHNHVGIPRPSHVAADGQIADKEGFFTVGGEKMKAAGLGTSPENNINCHCSVQFQLGENKENEQAVSEAIQDKPVIEKKPVVEKKSTINEDKIPDFSKPVKTPKTPKTADVNTVTEKEVKKYINEQYGSEHSKFEDGWLLKKDTYGEWNRVISIEDINKKIIEKKLKLVELSEAKIPKEVKKYIKNNLGLFDTKVEDGWIHVKFGSDSETTWNKLISVEDVQKKMKVVKEVPFPTDKPISKEAEDWIKKHSKDVEYKVEDGFLWNKDANSDWYKTTTIDSVEKHVIKKSEDTVKKVVINNLSKDGEAWVSQTYSTYADTKIEDGYVWWKSKLHPEEAWKKAESLKGVENIADKVKNNAKKQLEVKVLNAKYTDAEALEYVKQHSPQLNVKIQDSYIWKQNPKNAEGWFQDISVTNTKQVMNDSGIPPNPEISKKLRIPDKASNKEIKEWFNNNYSQWDSITPQDSYYHRYKDVADKYNIEMEELEAVRLYTGIWYEDINETLLGNVKKSFRVLEKGSEEWVNWSDSVNKYKNVLNSALDKLPKCNEEFPKTFRRSDHGLPEGVGVGSEYQFKAFMSTSTNGSVGKDRKYLYRIIHTNGKLIKNISIFEEENEILFKAGSKFRIKKITNTKYNCIIDMEEI